MPVSVYRLGYFNRAHTRDRRQNITIRPCTYYIKRPLEYTRIHHLIKNNNNNNVPNNIIIIIHAVFILITNDFIQIIALFP